MFNKQLKANIKEIDLQIGKLTKELDTIEDQDAYEMKMGRLDDLIEARCDLAESKVGETNAPLWISGALSIASVLIVLKYEEKDIVTSKAFGIATKLFKGV